MTSVIITFSKVSAILILFSLLLITSYPVWAQESTTGGGTRKDRIKERIEEKRETLKEKVATREAALKAKLQAFKDQKKAEIVERISGNLNRINAQRTEQMLKHLDKMTAILNKLEDRVNQGSPATAESKAKIASAEAAVKAQADKDYTLTVTSERKVKADAQAVRDRLHQDLQAVRKLAIDAKQSVANAIRVAKSGKLDIPGKEGTPSGQ